MPRDNFGHFRAGFGRYPAKDCIICGASFVPVVKKQKTCSDACGVKRGRDMSDRAKARQKAMAAAYGEP